MALLISTYCHWALGASFRVLRVTIGEFVHTMAIGRQRGGARECCYFWQTCRQAKINVGAPDVTMVICNECRGRFCLDHIFLHL